MSEIYTALLADIAEETRLLDAALDEALQADPDALSTATPAQGWSVKDQLSHLGGFDDAAVQALSEPEAFNAQLEALIAGGTDPIAAITDRGRGMSDDEVLSWWRSSRARLMSIAAPLDPRARAPWYGPPMSVMSKVTARLMETWAHGVDIGDAFGRVPVPSHRLRHVAHIGVGARPFSYLAHGREVPAEGVYVALDAPDSTVWEWGDPEAKNRVSGPALDFALLVTQRRNIADTTLVVSGDDALEWMSIAQAFAGPPGPGRPPQ